MSFMAQHAILRFEKHKGDPARPLETHHERQKDQYASNPDIDTSRSKFNFHIVKPEGRYYHFIRAALNRRGAGQGKTAPGLWIRLSPPARSFSRGSPQRRYKPFSRGRQTFSLTGWAGRISCRRGTHRRENTPPAFNFRSADKGQPPVRQRNHRKPGRKVFRNHR